MNRERIARTIQTASAVGLAFFALRSAFSYQSRQEIGKRDHWQCQDCGKSFDQGWMTHASHYVHDKNNPDYDEPFMGRIQCVEHHLAYHAEHKGRAHEIGLTENENNFAIMTLMNTEQRTEWWLEKNGVHSKGEYKQAGLDLEEVNSMLFGD